MGPNTLGRLRTSLSSAGYRVNFAQNNKAMLDAPEGGKPPLSILASEKVTNNKHKKVQRAPTSGMYVKMKQRPASSKPPIMGNFVHQSRNDSGSIMVSNLVKQHKLDMQSSDRVPLGPEEAYKGSVEVDQGHHNAADSIKNRHY